MKKISTGFSGAIHLTQIFMNFPFERFWGLLLSQKKLVLDVFPASMVITV